MSKKREKSVFSNYDLPFGRHLNAVARLYVGALRKRFEHMDLERHYSILILIESAENDCTQQYIADVLQKDKTSMVGIIDALEKKGYIKRASNPLDRRQHLIQLTAKAVKILPQVHEGINELNARATKGLTRQEVEKFHSCLQLISENLMKEPGYKIVSSFEKVKPE